MTEINYNEAYKNYEICRNCNRSTPEDDAYKSKKGKIVKTCNKCRASVLKSLAKKDIPGRRKMTLREQNNRMKIMLNENKKILDLLKKKYPELKTIMSIDIPKSLKNVENNEKKISSDISKDDIAKDGIAVEIIYY